MSTIREIGGTEGGILYLVTSNRITHLPPEFRRRFRLGTYFFSFPDEEEKRAIWDIYLQYYFGSGDVEPEFKDSLLKKQWTGAEIESCCMMAHLMKCSLTEAAAYIVPVAETAKDEINQLMDQADGRFLSASYPGVFKKGLRTDPVKKGKESSRRVAF